MLLLLLLLLLLLNRHNQGDESEPTSDCKVTPAKR
jgi:hypothetical protein